MQCLENAMTHEVRRHSDGSIDFDFYRLNITAVRRQAIRSSRALRHVCAGLLILVGVASVGLIAASPTPASRGFASTGQATPTLLR
jgi:hypothetical protein